MVRRNLFIFLIPTKISAKQMVEYHSELSVLASSKGNVSTWPDFQKKQTTIISALKKIQHGSTYAVPSTDLLRNFDSFCLDSVVAPAKWKVRAVIRFLWVKGSSTAEIHRALTSEGNIRQWGRDFSSWVDKKLQPDRRLTTVYNIVMINLGHHK